MKDDWKYTRTRQQHFTDAEVEIVRGAFIAGTRPQIVARALGCSTRVIYTRYNQLRGIEPPQRRAKLRPREKTKPLGATRFYKSTFTPE